MLLALLAFLAGALTILSPCILPVLPFVFARTGQPFVKSLLPLLIGMALTFAAVATLAALGGGWAVRANQYGRLVALVLLAAFGVMLLFPALADRFMRPLVSLGGRLSQAASDSSQTGKGVALGSFLLGVATGFLWTPCAGPILGLLLTGAALQGASAKTSLLLFTYAAGSACALALALLIGGRVLSAMKRSLGAGEWVRRALGVAVLAAVAVIALGLDTGFLTQLSLGSTSRIEQALLDKLRPSSSANAHGNASANAATPAAGASTLSIEGDMPELAGAVAWLNTEPLTRAQLSGKVVLIDFWTYSCINCLRSLPTVRAWAQKYKDHGLVVIGVHAPEFAFEKNLDNVRRAVRDLMITYPVAIDNDYAIWRAFDNEYWPADYLIDAMGRIREHHFGEGGYEDTERAIQQLLSQAGNHDVPTGYVSAQGNGVEAAANANELQSPETYIGYERAQNFASAGGAVQDTPHLYEAPQMLQRNQWALGGLWTDQEQGAVLSKAPGSIVFRFHARDLHLVLGPASGGAPIRFRVLLDGAAPGDAHGVDTDAQGNGVVKEERLYQLIRQTHEVKDRVFSIEFLDPGVQAFSFTFG